MKNNFKYLQSITKEYHCKEIGISVKDYNLMIKGQKEQISETITSISKLGEVLNNTDISSELNRILLNYIVNNNPEILLNPFKNK